MNGNCIEISPITSSESIDFLIELLSEEDIRDLIYNYIDVSQRSYNLYELASSYLNSFDHINQHLYCILNSRSPCGIIGASISNNIAEVGCIISSKECGKRIGSISSRLFYTELLKLRPDILEFSATTSYENLPSIKLMNSLGFTKPPIYSSDRLNNQRVKFKMKVADFLP